MTPQELKNSILQLAIQGKLVEQRAEEGTGEHLYREILAEKAKLVKPGKIKKEKPLPEIAEDEKPFEIPENWAWVRIANLCSVINGDRGTNYPSKETLTKQGIPFISALNLDGKTVPANDDLLCVSEEQYDKLGNGKLNFGDIVCCIRGSLGKHARYPFEKGAIASSLVILRLFQQEEITANYLLLYLDSPLFFSEIQRFNNGTAQPNLAARSLELFSIPLPPLAEQKRIVAKIEELLPYIDCYEQAWRKLEDFSKRFPGDMQKSILQFAIQGKLVEQRPEEGTGEAFYRQIQAEKQRLIKAGTIKKEKPLSEISEDEKPFEIPESWKWVRFGELGRYKKGPFGSALTKAIFVSKGNGAVKVYEQKNAIQKNSDIGDYYITRKYFEEAMSGFEVHPGDIIVSCAGTIGEAYVLPDGIELGIINQALMRMQLFNPIYIPYFLVFFDVVLKRDAQSSSKGSAIKNIPPFEVLKNYLVPLPPLAEQRRIVAKLEEILPLCEKLK